MKHPVVMAILLALVPVQGISVSTASFVYADSAPVFRDMVPGPSAPREKPAAAVRDLAGQYRVTGTNPNGSRYKGTLAITHEVGNRYSFRWSIGKDVFKGDGALVGKTLTVEWGDVSPVIYQVTENGTLEGLWHNGRGTETLVRENR